MANSKVFHKKAVPGDSANHPVYGWVQLVGKIALSEGEGDLWIARRGNLEHLIVAESELSEIGSWENVSEV